MGPIVTIGGLHGTGKTTYAAVLSAKLGLRHVSAGQLFRNITKEHSRSLSEMSLKAVESDEIDRLVDERIRAEAKKGNVVIDGLLAAWMARDLAHLKICLVAPENVRIERIAKRDNCSPQNAREETLFREELERRRFKRHYAIDIDDLSIYNLILDTGLLSPDGNIYILEVFARTYMKEYGGK